MKQKGKKSVGTMTDCRKLNRMQVLHWLPNWKKSEMRSGSVTGGAAGEPGKAGTGIPGASATSL